MSRGTRQYSRVLILVTGYHATVGQGIELGIITTEWNDEGGGSTCVVCLEKPCEIVFAQCGTLLNP